METLLCNRPGVSGQSVTSSLVAPFLGAFSHCGVCICIWEFMHQLAGGRWGRGYPPVGTMPQFPLELGSSWDSARCSAGLPGFAASSES